MTRRSRVVRALLLSALVVAALAVFVIIRLSNRTYPPAVPSGELNFTVNTRGHWDIAGYSAETGSAVLTPDDGFHDYFPSWDFASERINFLSNRAPDGSLAPTQIHPDGANLRTLDLLSAVTTLFFENRLDWDPAYSGGGGLVWASLRDLNLELYTRAADGEILRLTSGGARDWFAVWSPDGSRIAFASDRDGDENIYLVGADGTGLIQVTSNPADDVLPVWSLDGKALAFVSERDGELKDGVLNLYVIAVDDALAGLGESAVAPLPSGQDFEGGARFSADGNQVAVMARLDGKWDVLVYDVAEDRTIIRESAQTIGAAGDAMFPVWRP